MVDAVTKGMAWRDCRILTYHSERLMPPPPVIPAYPALIRFAVPVMLAAMATPLMGMVDTAVLGRLGDPAVIAAAGIGATIFTVIYWCFAFLRFTTTALVSQAIGRNDPREVLLAGLRPMLAAVTGGIGLWLLQVPIVWLALKLLSPPADVLPLARAYFNARIWSAPMTLLGYAQFAWLMGQGRARTVMLLQVALNALNAALAFLYVTGFHWGIAGAAWATVTSETCIAIVTTALILRIAPLAAWRGVRDQLLAKAAWRTLFSANVDITIRTLLLTGSFALMTERGARLGLMDLAANQILMQAFLLVANLLDGFATAAEVFGGRAIGAGSRPALVAIVRRAALLSLGWSLTLAAALLAVKPLYLRAMTSNVSLQETASVYWPWVAGLPLICIWAFLWDGVFMSAMRTRTLRNTMAGSVLIYVPTLFLLSSLWGNHGVWAGLITLMAARSLLLTLAWPKLRNAV
jgi:MATE family multidrug resistance protein